jgi:hypothetical protein
MGDGAPRDPTLIGNNGGQAMTKQDQSGGRQTQSGGQGKPSDMPPVAQGGSNARGNSSKQGREGQGAQKLQQKKS